MQIRARDRQAACSQRLVPVVFAYGGHGQLDFVVAQLPFKRARCLVIADVHHIAHIGGIVFLVIQGQVFRLNGPAGGQNNGPLHDVFQFAHVAGPGVALQQLNRIRLDVVHRLLEHLR